MLERVNIQKLENGFRCVKCYNRWGGFVKNCPETSDCECASTDPSAFYEQDKLIFDKLILWNLTSWKNKLPKNLIYMFQSIDFDRNWNAYYGIDEFDTSKVTDMSYMFYESSNFNKRLNGWNTTSVTNMSHMFYEAENFNQDLSDWDTSEVTDMSHMFSKAQTFNQDLSKWKTSKVTDMSQMFDDASSFNQDLSDWDTSKVTNMIRMFHSADRFKSDLSRWEIGLVTSMSEMFRQTDDFYSDLSCWKVGPNVDVKQMFTDARNFTSNLNDWTAAMNYSRDFTNSLVTENCLPLGTDCEEPACKVPETTTVQTTTVQTTPRAEEESTETSLIIGVGVAGAVVVSLVAYVTYNFVLQSGSAVKTDFSL